MTKTFWSFPGTFGVDPKIFKAKVSTRSYFAWTPGMPRGSSREFTHRNSDIFNFYGICLSILHFDLVFDYAVSHKSNQNAFQKTYSMRKKTILMPMKALKDILETHYKLSILKIA